MEGAPKLTGKQLEKKIKERGGEISKSLPKPSRKKAPVFPVETKKGSPDKKNTSQKPKAPDLATWVSKLSPEFYPRSSEKSAQLDTLSPNAGNTIGGLTERVKSEREEFAKARVKTEREKLLREMEDEVRHRRRIEDLDALKELADEAQIRARAAESQGDMVLSQQLQDASRALWKKMETEYVDPDEEYSVAESNLASIDANIDGMRSELEKQEKEKEMNDLLKRLAATGQQPEVKAQDEFDLEKEIRGAAMENVGRSAPETAKPVEGGEETPASAWEQHYEEEKAAFRKANPPQETTPEAWEEYYTEAAAAKAKAESFGYTVSPEKLKESFVKTAEDRGTVIETETPPEHKSFMRRRAAQWRALPTWSKVVVGGAMLGLGVAATVIGGPASSVAWGVWGAQRAFSAFGAWAAVDGMTERMKNKRVAGFLSGGAAVAGLMLPSTLHWMADHNILGLGDLLERFGFHIGSGDAVVPEGDGGKGGISTHYKNGIPSVPGHIDALFNKPIAVHEGDNVWNLLKAKLQAANLITNDMSPDTVNKKLVYLQNKLDALHSSGIKDILHIKSGNIHLIRPGELIDFSVVDKSGWLNDIKNIK